MTNIRFELVLVRTVSETRNRKWLRHNLSSYELTCPSSSPLGPPSPPLLPVLNPFSVLPRMDAYQKRRMKYVQSRLVRTVFNPVIPPVLLSLYLGSKSPQSIPEWRRWIARPNRRRHLRILSRPCQWGGGYQPREYLFVSGSRP